MDHERPDRKSPDYANVLLDRVRNKMAEWLGEKLEHIVRAVAVEETDAWLLAFYDKGNSAKKLDAKGAWERCVRKHGLPQKGDTLRQYDTWSDPLRKERERRKARKNNLSLERFLAELETLVTGP